MENNTVITAPAMPEATRSKYVFAPHDTVFAWLMLPAALYLIRYVICKTDGFQTSLFFMLMFALCLVYVKKAGHRLNASHIGAGVMICVFSAVFSINTNPLVLFLCFVFLSAAQLRWTQAVCTGTDFITRFLPVDLTDSVLKTPFSHFTAQPGAVSHSLRGSQTAAIIRYTVLGLLAALPLTVIVALLLSSADDGVKSVLDSIFGSISEDIAALTVQIFFAVPLSFFLFGGLYGAKMRAYSPALTDGEYNAKKARFRICPALILYVGVTPVCLLYLIYIFSQTSYFLSAFAGALPDGGTGKISAYAEYARKGFFELCVTAVIDLFVLIVLNTFSKRSDPDKKPLPLKIYSTAICLFTLFIISTALAKMILYIDEFGLTPLRLYTSWFMVLLAAVFIITMISGFINKIKLSKAISAAFAVLFAVLCFSRPDALIARYNIERYIRGDCADVDTHMLVDMLSDDALAVMTEYPQVFGGSGRFNDELLYRVRIYSDDPFTSMNISAQIIKNYVYSDPELSGRI